MKFQKIEFKNYRCFLNGVVDFCPAKLTPKKNIILFSAPNGGGKTQLLIAIEYVLYGYNFEKINGQGKTPWSLNQSKRNQLLKEREGKSVDSSVVLGFEHGGQVYRIERRQTFTKSGQGLKTTEVVSLNVTHSNGTTKVIRDAAEILRVVERIIPRNVLYAILCDGERVKQLSATADESARAVKTIVATMTDRKTLNLALAKLKEAKDGLVASKKRLLRLSGGANAFDETAEEVEEELKELQKEVKEQEKIIAEAEAMKKQIEIDIKQIAEVHQWEIEKEAKEGSLKDLNGKLDVHKKALFDLINGDGCWLLVDGLSGDVKQLVGEQKVPLGLVSDAVKDILKNQKCICGHEIGDEERKILEDLLEKLPPQNVNSLLINILSDRGSEQNREQLQRAFSTVFENISGVENEKEKRLQEILDLKERIRTSTNPQAASLESRNQEYEEQIRAAIVKKQLLLNEKYSKEELLQRIKNSNNVKATATDKVQSIDRQISMLLRSEEIINIIIDFRQDLAIDRINDFMRVAFEKLRSPEDENRQVVVTKADGLHRLLVYNDTAVKAEIAKRSTVPTEDEYEQILGKHSLSCSAGQLKITSLAFMKAILDYVRWQAGEGLGGKLIDDLPFVVDAPFGDIERENLAHATKYLHEYSQQIILMLAKKDIPENIMDYVCAKYEVSVKEDPETKYAYSVIEKSK